MRFKGLDLNLLVALDILFQELNVTRAAARMNTTQSTMSGILARLRDHFGDPLLVAYGRSLRQTPLAEQLQGPLREAIVRLESIVDTDGGFDPAVSVRHFKVEFPDHLIPVLLPRVTSRLAELAPRVTVEFSLPRGDPAPLLHRGELDLVLTPHTYRTAEFRFMPLQTDRMVVLGWKGNPALAQPPDTRLLDSLPIITVRFDPRRVSESLTAEQLKLIEGKGHIAYIAPTFSSIPLLLVGSRFITFLHRNLAENYAQRLPLVIHDLPFRSPVLRDVIMFHPNRANDQGLMWLADQILQVARTSRAGTRRPKR
jgi:LysR family transcriptional regulator, nod-box dependent transcriptional activator